MTRSGWWRRRCRFCCKLIDETSELLPRDCSSRAAGNYGHSILAPGFFAEALLTTDHQLAI
jgi:hypothetical protein